MKNFHKFKTAQERAEAFGEFCHLYGCRKCPVGDSTLVGKSKAICAFAWLDLEAEEEKPLPCPFCGAELDVSKAANTKSYGIHCECGYYAPWKHGKHEAIAAHNRVAKAVKESDVNHEAN